MAKPNRADRDDTGDDPVNHEGWLPVVDRGSLIRYMGDYHPELTFRIDRWRWVDPNTGAISDVKLRKVRGRLRWLVAVVDCPHCGGVHEHPMAVRSGWGFYRAGCVGSTSTVGYYLANPPG